METVEERRRRVREQNLRRQTEKREQARDRRDWQKERHLASIADSLEKIAASVEDEDGWLVKAILEHATVMKKDVAQALNNIAHRPPALRVQKRR